MKIIVFFTLLFICVNLYSQQIPLLKFEITDSILIKKKSKDVVCVPVKLEKSSLIDTLYIYRFNKFVSSDVFINSYIYLSALDLNKQSIQLSYIIEDLEGNLIHPSYVIHISFKNFEDEIRHHSKRKFVSPKLKIESKLLTDPELLEYDLAKFELTGNEQNITLYPLIDYYHKLSKGEYYLYFIYSFNEYVVKSSTRFGIRDDKKPDDSSIFRGSFVSNKVKLIVK